MTNYVVSLFMGVAVGGAYGLFHLRSPAPPLIALVGLLGMVLGQQAVDAARYHLATAFASTRSSSVKSNAISREP